MKRLVWVPVMIGFVAGGYRFIEWYYDVPENGTQASIRELDVSVPAPQTREPMGKVLSETIGSEPTAEVKEEDAAAEIAAAEEPISKIKPPSSSLGVGPSSSLGKGPPIAPIPMVLDDAKTPEPPAEYEYPGHGPITEALLSEKDPGRRSAILRQLIENGTDREQVIEAATAEAKRSREEGEKPLEWEALSYLFFNSKSEVHRDQMRARLDELVESIIFSRGPGPNSEMYMIQPGDSLAKIAAKYNCPVRLMQKINKIIDAHMIRAGSRLKVIKGNVEILVRRRDFSLTATLDGKYYRHYSIGIGADDLTPTGEFVVNQKIDDPTWYDKGRVIPPGDPENILGTRWLGFEATDTVSGIGIHGTTEPDTIGRKASAGCIRMHNKDVEELESVTPKGTHVRIE
ncbi:MAG: L,D-transpeptidase family protein [Planctomycetota bacterium]|nr:L,D-transpeptidase family protein [Planctomycetota bacterium]